MNTQTVILHAGDTCSGPFWDADNCEIGRYDSFSIGGTEYKITFSGFREWYEQADRFDPYTDVEVFNIDGFDDWVNQGYTFAVMLRKILPKEVDVFYAFWKNFGDGNWRYCKAYISM